MPKRWESGDRATSARKYENPETKQQALGNMRIRRQSSKRWEIRESGDRTTSTGKDLRSAGMSAQAHQRVQSGQDALIPASVPIYA